MWIFSPFLLHLAAQYGSALGLRAAKGLYCWFRADLGTNLIKQEEISTMRLGSSVVRIHARCVRVLGSSPGGAMCFFLPCGTHNIWSY